MVPRLLIHPGDTPSFAEHLSEQKEALIDLVANQGYSEQIIRDVVEKYGVLTPNPMHAIDVMFHLHKENVTVPSEKRSVNGVASIADRMRVPNILQSTLLDKAKNAVEVRRTLIRVPGKSNEKLSNLCGICFENPIDVRLDPCGHEIICHACFTKLPKVCPLCRDVVDGAVEVAQQEVEDTEVSEAGNFFN